MPMDLYYSIQYSMIFFAIKYSIILVLNIWIREGTRKSSEGDIVNVVNSSYFVTLMILS
jgi:hypothetical protein